MTHQTSSHPVSTTSSHTHRKAWLDRILYARSSKAPPWSLQLPITTIILLLLITLLAIPTNARPNIFYAGAFANVAQRASSLPESNGELASISTASGSGSFEMPRAFDASVGNNFTQPRCQRWFNNFMDEIQPCYPVSLMLQTSISFFDATKSLTLITRVLDTACSVNYPQCTNLMSRLAREIVSDDVCSQDYQLQNPTVAQAYAGLLAYQPLFGATCLKNTGTAGGEDRTPTAAGGSATSILAAPTASASAGEGVFDRRGYEDTNFGEDDEDDTSALPQEDANGEPTPTHHHYHRRSPQLRPPQATSNPSSPSNPSSTPSTSTLGAYCYAQTITNTTSPTSSYIYYLPLGFSLPGGTIPTCNSCLQDTMALFAGYAGNSSQPLSKVYGQAGASVNVWCGPGFVGESGMSSAGVGRGAGVSTVVVGVVVAVVAFWLI